MTRARRYVSWRQASCLPWSRGFQPGGAKHLSARRWEIIQHTHHSAPSPGGWKPALYGRQDALRHTRSAEN